MTTIRISLFVLFSGFISVCSIQAVRAGTPFTKPAVIPVEKHFVSDNLDQEEVLQEKRAGMSDETKELVRWHADFILEECVLPDGAINMHPRERNEIWIVPYFSHITCMGLLRAYEVLGDEKYLEAVRNWILWYAMHVNDDGTVNDYIGGSYPNYKNTGTYDAADSYAALFAYIVWAYYRVSGDRELVQQVYYSVLLTYKSLEDILKWDDLTIAKKGYGMKFLMDNSEVRVGFIAYSKIASLVGDNSNVRLFREKAEKTTAALQKKYWNPKTGFYAVEINNLDDRNFRMKKWYPDALANILYIQYVLDGDDPATKDLFLRVVDKFLNDTEAEPPHKGRDAQVFLWWVQAAQKAGNPGQYAEKFFEMYRKEMGGMKRGRDKNMIISNTSGYMILALTPEFNPPLWYF